MQRVYFDLEFTGLHQETEIISLGMEAKLPTGDVVRFYAETPKPHSFMHAIDTEFYQEEIAPNLILQDNKIGQVLTYETDRVTTVLGNKSYMKMDAQGWLSQISEETGKRIQMWGDCLSYDWVLFNQLWGHAFNLPKFISYIPMDICTLFHLAGVDADTNREAFAETIRPNDRKLKHNALFDAGVVRKCAERLELMLEGKKCQAERDYSTHSNHNHTARGRSL